MIEARIRQTRLPGPGARGPALDVEFRSTSGVTVLFGSSGAGKTLVLDAIAGLLRPDEGRILVDDQILYDREAKIALPPRTRRCGYVFPDHALLPHMTLRQNLLFAASCHRLARLERHRRVNEALERFRLAEAAGRIPAAVSDSERQRCAVARAMIGQPRLLLVDEPACGAGTTLRAELHDLVREVRAESGVQVLLATRDMDECFTLGEELLVMHAGRVVQSGSPRQVFDQPANVDVARLFGCFNLLPVSIEALDPAKKTSRLKFGEAVLAGPYFPGRLRGDRVTLCVRDEELRAAPAAGKPGPNQVAASLVRAAERRASVRLHFAGGMIVDLPRAEYEDKKHARDWVVEFPQESLRVL
jgi:ABC-type sulfate/molybdate transport systems ATPase subunit